jgi:hypothetical protein
MLKILTIIGFLANQFLPAFGPLPTTIDPRPIPESVRAIYATAYTVQHPNFQGLRNLIKRTELNAIIINTKEPSGPKLYPKLGKVVTELKSEGVWTIARHVVFQDDELASRRPDLALKKADGKLWRDSGGRTWVDPAAQEVWQYNLKVARATLALGFDEINLDYIRFPTDGNTDTIHYPVWNKKTSREDTIASFARWFRRELKAIKPEVKISADLFAYTFLEDNDLGMGQRLSKLAPNFDVLAPMIYPSHYSPNNFNFPNPAEHPYEVVKQTLEKGKHLLINSPLTIIRPWIQDFDMGADYTVELVKAEIKAISDAGYKNGWMLWNPKNIYTEGALKDN